MKDRNIKINGIQYKVPSEWKSFLGEDVLSLKISIRDFCKKHHLDATRLLRRLHSNQEFNAWYSQEKQLSIANIRQSQTVTINGKDYNIIDDWRFILGEDVLAGKKTVITRLTKELNLSRQRHFKLLSYLKTIPEFSALYSRQKQVSLTVHSLDREEMVKRQQEGIKARFGSKGLMADEVAAKRVKTNLERYGSVSPLGNEQIRFKAQHSMNIKYGGHPLQNIKQEERQNLSLEAKQSRQDVYAKHHASILKTRGLSEEELVKRCTIFGVIPLEPLSQMANTSFKAKCLMCGREFISHFASTGLRPTSCAFCNRNSTVLERSIANELSKEFRVIPHFRCLHHNQEIDIYLPDLKLGVEVNGIFSHNSSVSYPSLIRQDSSEPKPVDYHLRKTEEALAQGIELIHIWEHEPWRSKGLVFLEKRLKNQHLDFLKESQLPQMFKLRRDFYPSAPYIQGYSYTWHNEIWHTDRNGAISTVEDVVTYTSGVWIYTRIS